MFWLKGRHQQDMAAYKTLFAALLYFKRGVPMKFTVKQSLLLLACAACFPAFANAAVVETANPEAASAPEITVLLPGKAHDNGFMEAGYRGYERIAKGITKNVKCVSDVSATSDPAILTAELQKLAKEQPKLIIGHGGQMNGPVSAVSKEYPQIQFVVIQGNVKGDNISSYVVNQEQSAFLAGALAGYMTKTGKVGHISGAWPKPGLQARAAFYNGLKYANPHAQFYSTFTGDLDNMKVNANAASAQIDEGVDVIYTMLNSGRSAVNQVISNTNGQVLEIGNVIDWTKESPIFAGSAVADSSVALFNAAKDYQSGALTHDITKIGLEKPDVVRLAIAPFVPAEAVDKLEDLHQKIVSGKVQISTTYDGPEFDTATKTFVSQDAKNQRKAKK